MHHVDRNLLSRMYPTYPIGRSTHDHQLPTIFDFSVRFPCAFREFSELTVGIQQ